MDKLFAKLSEISANICGWLLVVLMALLAMDIVFRALGHPILGVAELSMCVMLTTVYLGLSNCEYMRGHVKVDFLITLMPKRLARYFEIFSGIIAVITVLVCSWAMSVNAIDSYTGGEAMAGLVPYPIWPIKSIMAVGIILYLFATILNLIKVIKDRPGQKPSENAANGGKA